MIRYWSSLEEAWRATENQPVRTQAGAIPSSSNATEGWSLIKDEARGRVILLEPGAPLAPLICKIYRTPRHLVWRTIGMCSRANREFTALLEAHRRSLPVVCPRYWMESRLAGGLKFSAIIMEMIVGNNLEKLLKTRETSGEQRMYLARQTGALLGQLHRGGLHWATARPRNVMVQQSRNDKLLAIDMPYARWYDRDLTDSDLGLIDVRGMLRCKNEDWRFNQQERMEFLIGYCADDRAKASELEPLTEPHSLRQSKLERLTRRSAIMMFRSPRSHGSGGAYHLPDASYHLRDSQLIGIE